MKGVAAFAGDPVWYKIMKKFFTIIICCLYLLPCLFFVSSAEGDKTVFCLDYANVTISDTKVSGYDMNGKSVTKTNSAGYIVTQKDPNKVIDRGITVSASSADIEIKDLNVKRKKETESPLSVTGSSSTVITLSGDNRLIGGMYRAGLEVGLDTTVTINGDGTLYAESGTEAGIGGGNGHSNGTLIINSGTITAVGGTGGYGSGIGGGSSGAGGNITINGGTVFAQGGDFGAGIGGGDLCSGGNVTINGGTVTAVGGKNAAGIGGGYGGRGGTVVINGGSVKATAGLDAQDIGNGYKCTTAFAGVFNSAGSAVSPVSIGFFDFSEIYVNGIDTAPMTAGHPDDENLYFYTDNTSVKPVTVYMNDGTVSYFTFSKEALNEIHPFANDGDERYFDVLITDDLASYEDSSAAAVGFEVNSSELYYGDICIDTFTLALLGDTDLDGEVNAMDAVIADCIVNSMLNDTLSTKLSDVDKNGVVTEDDVLVLEESGLFMVG